LGGGAAGAAAGGPRRPCRRGSRPGQRAGRAGALSPPSHRRPRLLGEGTGLPWATEAPGGQPATTRGWAMEIQHAMGDGCLVVRFAGSIDLFSVSAVQRTLLKDLSQQPYGLICDLAGVSHLDPVCASVFATVANHPASRWPTTSFLLCNPQPPVAEILGRLQMPQFLPLYASLEEALDAAVGRPPYLRDELRLAPTLTAAAVARTHIRDILGYWQLALPDTTVVGRAVLVANELVTNAVVHARTELRVPLGVPRGPLS